jgi:hypothetical protein
MMIVLIPSDLAISQACCPPAPPKLASLQRSRSSERDRREVNVWFLHVLRGCISFRLAQGANRPAHGLIRDFDESSTVNAISSLANQEFPVRAPINNFIQGQLPLITLVDRLRQFLKRSSRDLNIQRLFLRFPKYLWKVVGYETS